MSDQMQNVSNLQKKLKAAGTPPAEPEPAKPKYDTDYIASRDDYIRGGYQDGYDKLQALLKQYPDAANDPKVRNLKARLEVALNIR
jgi:hypothetical protein